MGTIEFKDVLRVEVPARGALSAILREKQLGFERDGAKVRLGYKDSAGSMHYFEEGVTGPASEYWKPFEKGIKYTTPDGNGNVAIGCPQTDRRLEVQDSRNFSGSCTCQIRLSYSDSLYSEIGSDDAGNCRIRSLSGDIYLEPRYSEGGSGTGLACIKGPGLRFYGTMFGAEVRLHETDQELEITSDVDFDENVYLHQGKRIRFQTTPPSVQDSYIGLESDDLMVKPYGKKLHLFPLCGDIVLETTLPGNYKIDMSKSLCLKLPMKTTPGDPSGEDGSLYYNAADKAVRFYGGSQWRDVLKWT